ncbi:MAG: phospholipase D family protein [Kiloniellales bacterium]
MENLFDIDAGTQEAPPLPLAAGANAIQVFDIKVLATRELEWRALFEGFLTLKVITFSASMPAILDVAQMFEDVEITFGSERVLSREIAALEQATTAAGYRFTDAIADQKAFIERFVRPALSRRGEQLLERVQDGTLRFRLLRQVPSHAKLYLLAGENRFRVVTGSANLSVAALTGQQRETFFVADGEADYWRFMEYYDLNEERSDPVAADLLVIAPNQPDEPKLAVPEDPVDVLNVPCIRFLRTQGAIVEAPRPPVMPELSTAAMRHASELGAELRQLSLDRNRNGATVVTANGFARAYRAHASRPITDKTDRVPAARIDLATGLVTLDGRPWHRVGAPVPWPEVQGDAQLLAPYFEGFARFYGDAAGVSRSYWALTCWLYAAPFAPLLRSAALRHDGSPLAFPVHAVLYGRSDGGKTMFSRVISRSMFGIEQMIRGQHFTTARALGLREQLGAIPLLIDDVNRDRFSQYVPDLVKFDHESGEGYAPILISTNRDVTAVTPDLRKRMIVCHIDGARPRSIPEAPARAALSKIGTALYRSYLDRVAPRIPRLIEALAENADDPPDLLRLSSEILGDLLGEVLDELPSWATPIGISEVDQLKDKPLLDLLGELVEQDSERVSVNRSAGELVVHFGGDHHQAARFEKLVPAQALKGRFADAVKLDPAALEQEYGFDVAPRSRRSLLARLLRR